MLGTKCRCALGALNRDFLRCFLDASEKARAQVELEFHLTLKIEVANAVKGINSRRDFDHASSPRQLLRVRHPCAHQTQELTATMSTVRGGRGSSRGRGSFQPGSQTDGKRAPRPGFQTRGTINGRGRTNLRGTSTNTRRATVSRGPSRGQSPSLQTPKAIGGIGGADVTGHQQRYQAVCGSTSIAGRADLTIPSAQDSPRR